MKLLSVVFLVFTCAFVEAGPRVVFVLGEEEFEGEAPEPVAWTNRVGENGAKIFYTSLGQGTEF